MARDRLVDRSTRGSRKCRMRRDRDVVVEKSSPTVAKIDALATPEEFRRFQKVLQCTRANTMSLDEVAAMRRAADRLGVRFVPAKDYIKLFQASKRKGTPDADQLTR